MPPTRLNNKIITDALSLEYGRRVNIEPIEDATFKAEVADATLKFLVPTPTGDAGFMLVSGAGNPYLVQRAVDNIQAARDSVSDRTGVPILPPVSTGRVEGRTFAVWPMKRPLLTSNRVMRRLKGRFYARRVTSWVAALCRETLVPADPKTVLGDLCVITEDSAFSDEIRQAARKAATRLRMGQWQPMHCLSHGDFWSGNLLLPSRSEAPPFYVIDWAGMQPQGYPFLDLLRILMSLRCGAHFNANCVKDMCQSVGCDKEDVIAYILSAYGQIGANLEYFPPDRFRAATVSIYQFVNSI